MKFVLIAVLLVAVLATTTYAATVTECGLLNESDTYTLANSINSTSDCLTLLNSSITIDCAGFTINYSQGASGHGIVSNHSANLTIMNCNVWFLSTSLSLAHGINFTRVNNSLLINNNITVQGSSSIGAYFTNLVNSTIRNNTIRTLGTGGNKYGIQVVTGANNTVFNNSISTNGTGSTNSGVYFLTTVTRNVIANNRITANSSSGGNFGVRVVNTANYNIVANNSINTGGSGGANPGIDIQNTAIGNLIQGNDVVCFSPGGSAPAMSLQTTASNNTVINNTFRTSGASSADYGVFVGGTNSFGNFIVGNTIDTNGTQANHGIYLSNAHNSTIANNTIRAVGSTDTNNGIRIDNSLQNNVTGNFIRTNGTRDVVGIVLVLGAHNNRFDGNNISTSGLGSYAISIHTSNGTIFNNTIFNNPTEWFYTPVSTNNTFINTTFTASGNKLRFASSLIFDTPWNVTREMVALSATAVYVNSTNLSVLNTSARLFQPGNFNNANIKYDPEDDGTFIDCPGTICTLISNVGGIVTFDVAHFTNFTITEAFVPPAPEFGTWMMMLLALGLVVGGVLRVRRQK